jgi:hypothetical protein
MVVARSTQPTLLWSSNSHCGWTVRPVNVMARPVNVMARPVNVMARPVNVMARPVKRHGRTCSGHPRSTVPRWMAGTSPDRHQDRPATLPFDLRRQPVPHRRVANRAAQQRSRARHDVVVAACGFRPTRPTRTHRRLPTGTSARWQAHHGVGSWVCGSRPLPRDSPRPGGQPSRPLRLPLHRVLS